MALGIGLILTTTNQKTSLKSAKVGDTVAFGSYEQDDKTTDGTEDIEWVVIDERDGYKLLLSKYALDCKPYNGTRTDVTWETCSLREWLNSDFLDAAFTSIELGKISCTRVSNADNQQYGTEGGNDTYDYAFLLSISDASSYLDKSGSASAVCEPTAYAERKGVGVSSNGGCRWWLRSPGRGADCAANVHAGGYVLSIGYVVDYDAVAVRPALWVSAL